MVSVERARSLEYRLRNENILAEKALQRPFFGWGGYGRSAIYGERGKVSVTDGIWIIMLGKSGLVGLGSFLAMYMVPLLLFDRRFPSRSWSRPDIAPGAAVATVILMSLINNVPNATMNPLVHLAIGGTAAFSSVKSGRRRKRRPESPSGAHESLAKRASGTRSHPETEPDR
jgi:O-antigen ligase